MLGKMSLLLTGERAGWAVVDQYILEKRRVPGCLARKVVNITGYNTITLK
jgi:hypothetical protein